MSPTQVSSTNHTERPPWALPSASSSPPALHPPTHRHTWAPLPSRTPSSSSNIRITTLNNPTTAPSPTAASFPPPSTTARALPYHRVPSRPHRIRADIAWRTTSRSWGWHHSTTSTWATTSKSNRMWYRRRNCPAMRVILVCCTLRSWGLCPWRIGRMASPVSRRRHWMRRTKSGRHHLIVRWQGDEISYWCRGSMSPVGSVCARHTFPFILY